MNFLRISTLFAAITSCFVLVVYAKDFIYAYIHDFDFSITFLVGSIAHILFYLALTVFFIALFLHQKSDAQ